MQLKAGNLDLIIKHYKNLLLAYLTFSEAEL